MIAASQDGHRRTVSCGWSSFSMRPKAALPAVVGQFQMRWRAVGTLWLDGRASPRFSLRPCLQSQYTSGTIIGMLVEIPKSGGQIEAQLMPADEPFAPLSVKLGKSGHVVYRLPAMLKMGFRIVECTPGELAIMESHG